MGAAHFLLLSAVIINVSVFRTAGFPAPFGSKPFREGGAFVKHFEPKMEFIDLLYFSQCYLKPVLRDACLFLCYPSYFNVHFLVGQNGSVGLGSNEAAPCNSEPSDSELVRERQNHSETIQGLYLKILSFLKTLLPPKGIKLLINYSRE